MHVMDTDCEKIGGGCIAGESAPELNKQNEILVGDNTTTTTTPTTKNNTEILVKNNVIEEKTTLVNGGSDHTTDNKKQSVTITDISDLNNDNNKEIVDNNIVESVEDGEGGEVEEEDEEDEEVVEEDTNKINEVIEDMDVDMVNEKDGTKVVPEEDDDEEEDVDEDDEVVVREIVEENLGQVTNLIDEKKVTDKLVNNEEEMIMDKGVVEEDEIEGENLVENQVDVDKNLNDTEITKEVVEDTLIVPPAVTATEQSGNVEISSKDNKSNNVSNKTDTSKPTSPVAPLALNNKESKDESIPVNTNLDKSTVGFSNKLNQKEIEKRKMNDKDGEGEISSGSESDSSRKKIKVEPDLETTPNNSEQPPSRVDHPAPHIVDDDRERFIQEFIAQCSQSVEEMDRAADRLHKEVETLAELARAKELEWNAILRVRKMREEMLERLLRKRRLTTEEYLDRSHLENSLANKNHNKYQGNNQLMMVPIVSSSPGAATMSNRGPPPVRLPEYGKQQRPILPKPYANIIDPNYQTREGRNGPIVDVKSIIADYSSGYRSRHPESVPRRGRRMRGGPIIEPPPNRLSANPSLISMANMALGSGASIRTVTDSPYNLSQDHSRPSSTDPTRGTSSDGSGNMGYKDVLVQFAKLTNQAGVGGPHGGKGPPNGIPPGVPPPPPYPEVTLHPVSRPGSSPPTAAPTSSLLHGILTKSSGALSQAAAAASAARPPANFSPTLARLLTAPDRPPHPIQQPPHFRPQQHQPRVSIADILSSSKKSRNEITITPVPGNPSAKPKDDVVLLPDEDESETSDRLVIDESGDNEEVPQCQGCRQKPAQFVCAGCGNQWYCSRECQVTAWEEHSDVCSG